MAVRPRGKCATCYRKMNKPWGWRPAGRPALPAPRAQLLQLIGRNAVPQRSRPGQPHDGQVVILGYHAPPPEPAA